MSVALVTGASRGLGRAQAAGLAERGWTLVVDGRDAGALRGAEDELAMLEAVAGRELLEASYRQALESGYLWHEFGDSHLILP